MGIETFPSNHIPVSCGTCYVVGELGTCVCSDAYLDTVQSTNHMMLYGNDFGPNYSNSTTQTTRSQRHISN
jgi:hypothetical protein